MGLRKANASQCAVTLFAATALIVGCNTSTMSYPAQTIAQSHRISHLTSEQTTVQVINQENETITGSLTPVPCWTVSPLPVPTVSASPGKSPFIVETYDSTCAPNHNKVTLEYNFGSGFAICDFVTKWTTSGFTYSASGNQGNCTVQPSTSGAAVDQDLVFGLILGNHPRNKHRQ